MRGRIIPTIVLLGAFAAAIHLAGRTQEDAWEKAFAARLADDALAPDASAQAAQALRAGARGEGAATERAAAQGATATGTARAAGGGPRYPEDRLEGRAKLRYLLATGYTMRELGPNLGGSATSDRDDLAAVGDGLAAAGARETRATEAVAGLAAANLDVPARFLAESRDPALRKRAAQALGLVSDARALPPLRAALDDADEGVRVSALVSGIAVGRRAKDEEGLAALLLAATRHRALVTRAFEAAKSIGGPRMVPVHLAILEQHDAALGDADRSAGAAAILEAAGPERAKTAPERRDAASLRAWWNSFEGKQ